MGTLSLRNRKGSAMLTVIILFAVVMIAGTTAIALSRVASQGAGLEVREQEAYYVAKSAVDAMVSAIQKQDAGAVALIEELRAGAPKVEGDNTWGSGESYHLTLEPYDRGDGGEYYKITADAKYNGATDSLSAIVAYQRGNQNVNPAPDQYGIVSQNNYSGLAQILNGGNVYVSDPAGGPLSVGNGYNITGTLYSRQVLQITGGASVRHIVSSRDVDVSSGSHIDSIMTSGNVTVTGGNTVGTILCGGDVTLKDGATAESVICGGSVTVTNATVGSITCTGGIYFTNGNVNGAVRTTDTIQILGDGAPNIGSASSLASRSITFTSDYQDNTVRPRWTRLNSAQLTALTSEMQGHQSEIETQTQFLNFEDLDNWSRPAGLSYPIVTHDCEEWGSWLPNGATHIISSNCTLDFRTGSAYAGNSHLIFDTSSGDLHVVLSSGLTGGGVDIKVQGGHRVFFYLPDGQNITITNGSIRNDPGDINRIFFVAEGQSTIDFHSGGSIEAYFYGKEAVYRQGGGVTLRGTVLTKDIYLNDNTPMYYLPSDLAPIGEGTGGTPGGGSGSGEYEMVGYAK